MYKIHILSFIFLLYSCGGDNTTSPPDDDFLKNYHSDDSDFITELVSSNAIELDSLNDRIQTLTIEGSNEDRISELDLSNLGLETLPDKINNQIRKFLKQVGINSHRKINERIREGNNNVRVRLSLEIDGKRSDNYEVEIKV